MKRTLAIFMASFLLLVTTAMPANALTKYPSNGYWVGIIYPTFHYEWWCWHDYNWWEEVFQGKRDKYAYCGYWA